MTKAFIQEKSTHGTGEKFFLKNRMTIGRSLDNTITLNYASASRLHAEISLINDAYHIKDLKSRNGTFVNSRKISSQKLFDGDVIAIPPKAFIFHSPEHLKIDEIQPDEKKTEDMDEHFMNMSTIRNLPKEDFPEEKILTKEEQSIKNFQLLIESIQAFSSNEDLDLVLENVIEGVLKIIPGHNVAIFQKNERGILTLKIHRQRKGVQEEFLYSKSIIRKTAQEKQAVLIVDTSQSEKFKAEASIVDYDIRSAMCAPLLYHGELIGIIYMDTHGIVKQFDENSLQLLSGVSSAAAAAIYNSLILDKVKQQAKRLETANYQIMFSLANTIEARDHYTAGHTWRVTRFSEIIARALGWPEEKMAHLRTGGVLHDIGKVGIPDNIIQKPGKLTSEEYDMIKTHPKRGAMILKESNCLPEAIPYILYHHERYDGQGYPYQLKEKAIPIEGRIMSVADAFDAMTSDRPYRKGMSSDKSKPHFFCSSVLFNNFWDKFFGE